MWMLAGQAFFGPAVVDAVQEEDLARLTKALKRTGLSTTGLQTSFRPTPHGSDTTNAVIGGKSTPYTPAAAVEPAGVVLELVQHLLHLECRRDRLEEGGRPARSTEKEGSSHIRAAARNILLAPNRDTKRKPPSAPRARDLDICPDGGLKTPPSFDVPSPQHPHVSLSRASTRHLIVPTGTPRSLWARTKTSFHSRASRWDSSLAT